MHLSLWRTQHLSSGWGGRYVAGRGFPHTRLPGWLLFVCGSTEGKASSSHVLRLHRLHNWKAASKTQHTRQSNPGMPARHDSIEGAARQGQPAFASAASRQSAGSQLPAAGCRCRAIYGTHVGGATGCHHDSVPVGGAQAHHTMPVRRQFAPRAVPRRDRQHTSTLGSDTLSARVRGTCWGFRQRSVIQGEQPQGPPLPPL